MPDTIWRCSSCNALSRSLSGTDATVGVCPQCVAGLQAITPLTPYELQSLEGDERATVAVYEQAFREARRA